LIWYKDIFVTPLKYDSSLIPTPMPGGDAFRRHHHQSNTLFNLKHKSHIFSSQILNNNVSKLSQIKSSSHLIRFLRERDTERCPDVDAFIGTESPMLCFQSSIRSPSLLRFLTGLQVFWICVNWNVIFFLLVMLFCFVLFDLDLM